MNVNTLTFILTDLLEKRLDSLRLLSAGHIYEAKLRKALNDLQSSPQSGKDNIAHLTERMREVGTLPDSAANALWYFFLACSSYPYISPDQRVKLADMQELFIARRSETRSSYATQSGRAIKRRALLNEHKDVLSSFPTPDGQTLYAWVEAYIHNGEQLGALLTQRADAQNTQQEPSSRSNVGPTLSATRGLLSRIRQAVQDELDVRDDLPQELETDLFGLHDALSKAKPSNTQEPSAQDPKEDTPTEE